MTASLSAWWPTALFFAAVGAALALSVGEGESRVDIAVNLVVYSAFAVTGGWIAFRSGNRMGRLFQALAVTAAVLFLTEGYLGSSLPPDHIGLPEGGLDLVMMWANNLIFVPFFTFNFVLPFLLFPTGHAASTRWSYVVKAVLVLMSLAMAAILVGPQVELADEFGGPVDNPWAIEPLAGPAGFLSGEWFFAMISVLGILAVASLVFRYRTSGVEQRAQIRWFLLAGVFLILGLILDEVVLDALSLDAPVLESAIELAVQLLGLLGLPVATAIAILKYRLYEVDVVINKTLVYTSLTAILAALYSGLVVVMQRLVPGITGDSDLAIAAATLAVAGLFRPLRTRLQGFIDRRFYRRRYDAASTLGEFASHARDEVDLASLSRELVRVVGTTMQPAHASIWLRSGGSPGPEVAG